MLRRFGRVRFGSVRLYLPVHREVTIDDTDTIIYDFICMGQVVPTDILVDGATTAQLRKFFYYPG
jgi:hypothetical protein